MRTSDPGPVDSTAISAALATLASTLAAAPTLSAHQRKRLRDQIRPAPQALTDLVCKVAETSGGTVAGAPIDVAGIRASQEAIRTARDAADVARRIAAILEDDALQREGAIAGRIFGTFKLLRRAHTIPDGANLARAFEEMAAIVRETQRRAPTKSAKGGKTRGKGAA